MSLRVTQTASLMLGFSVSLPVMLPWIGFSMVQFCAILVVIVFILEVSWRRSLYFSASVRQTSHFRLVIVSVLLLAAAALASALVAQDPGSSVGVSLRYGMGAALIIALVTSHQGNRALHRLASALVVGACLAAALAIVGFQLPQVGEMTIGVSRRARVFFEHPNQLGMVLSAIFCVPVARFLRNPRSLGSLASALLIAVGVVLSGSMANVLLLVGGILIILLTGLRRTPLTRKLGLGIGATILLGCLFLAGTEAVSALSPRLGGLIETLTTPDTDVGAALPSVTERLNLYSDAWRLFVASPLLGIGAGNAYLYLQTPSGRSLPHAHNFLLDVLMSMGIIGAMAVCAFAFAWLTLAIRSTFLRPPFSSGLQAGIGSALLVFFASNQSSDSLGGTVIYLAWILLSIAIVIVAQYRRSRWTARPND